MPQLDCDTRARIERFFTARTGDGPAQLVGYELIPGGYSRETAKVWIEHDGGLTGYVLRSDALQTSAVDSLLLADAQASYERASHVLSTAIECAFRSGSDEHITAVTTAVQERIHHQDLVTGAFEAVGRT